METDNELRRRIAVKFQLSRLDLEAGLVFGLFSPRTVLVLDEDACEYDFEEKLRLNFFR